MSKRIITTEFMEEDLHVEGNLRPHALREYISYFILQHGWDLMYM